MPDAAIAVYALQLLGRWQRVRNGHLAFSAGCACTYGGSIDLSEFDELILDYLRNKFSQDAAVIAFIAQRACAAPGQPERLSVLLQALTTPAAATAGAAVTVRRAPGNAPALLAAKQARAVLQALEGSVASIEEQHP